MGFSFSLEAVQNSRQLVLHPEPEWPYSAVASVVHTLRSMLDILERQLQICRK